MTVVDGYIKLNDTELPIMYENNGYFSMKKIRYFEWRDKKYYLKDFVVIKNREGDCWVYPDFINAVEAKKKLYPYYIEYIGRFAVNIYREGTCSYV